MFLHKHLVLLMPLVTEIAHDEGVVKGDAASRKSRFIGKEGRLDVLNGEGAHKPVACLKTDSIETATITGDGIAHATALEVGG